MLDQWSAWFSKWEREGDADPGFALLLYEACQASIRALRRLGADLPSLRDQTPGSRLEDRLPLFPSSQLQPVPWFEDEQEYIRSVNKWTFKNNTSLIGEIWVWMNDLKASPSTSFIADPPTMRLEQIEPVQPASPEKEVVEARDPKRMDRDPGSKAIGAAYQLRKEGKRITQNAVCKLAKVDRKNLSRRYPEVVIAIRNMGTADMLPRHTSRDGSNGDSEEDQIDFSE